MRELVLVGGDTSELTLDAAAAIARSTSADGLTWALVYGSSSSNSSGEPAGPAEPAAPTAPAEPAEPAGLRWLVPGAPPPVSCAAAPAEIIRALLAKGIVYGCACDENRLRRLAADALSRGERPRYDGRCRDRAPGDTPRRYRLRSDAGATAGGREDALEATDRALGSEIDLAALLVHEQPERIIVEARFAESARTAVRLGRALDARLPEAEPAGVVIGPDGTPLWIRGQRWSVPALRALGVEADGLLRFLRRTSLREVIWFDLESLDRSNRDVLLEVPETTLRARVGEELARHGVVLGDEALERAVAALRPRLRRLGDAGRFLGFLAPGFDPPPVAESDRPQIERVRSAIEAVPLPDGLALTGALEDLAHGRSDLHDLRRVLRWALTGQEIAPALARVWELLGEGEARGRLRRAAGPTRRQPQALEPGGFRS